jgi:hypothetical protein
MRMFPSSTTTTLIVAEVSRNIRQNLPVLACFLRMSFRNSGENAVAEE